MKIAVDFDGTIVEHAFPEIGKEKLFAIETIKEIQKLGHLIILWTVRKGKELDEAVKYCKSRGLEFYAVNKNYPEEEIDENYSRKIEADIFIDDRNIGGFMEWNIVWELLNPNAKLQKKEELNRIKNKKRSFFKR